MPLQLALRNLERFQFQLVELGQLMQQGRELI
nr:MAG TPA: hypothetical protein [Caudoviricetes sp.]